MVAICTLDDQIRCCRKNCKGCGWNLKEQKRRERLIAQYGLTPRRKNGLKRLIIEEEESEE